MQTEQQHSPGPDLDADPNEDIGDDVLRLVFIACHPVLSTEARMGLTLGLLGGLTTEEIARREPVLLMDQDRAHWDHLLIRRGLAALQRAEQLGGTMGPYALQAAIAACHARARSPCPLTNA